MNVSSNIDREADFATYRTYEWGPADALPTGDPRLDDDPAFHDRFQGAVEKHLAARGLQLLVNGDSDLLIHYHANVTERIDVNTIDRRYGECAPPECDPLTRTYEAGTLVLDIVDARSNKLIWRGWAQTSLEHVLGDPERLARVVDEAATRMLERYPDTRRPADVLQRR
jgi:hypothetical protein